MSPALLAEIVRHKQAEVASLKSKRSVDDLKNECADMDACRGFETALAKESGSGLLGVIAEAKRRSPSAGDIAATDDTASRVSSYERCGATCVSLLTDKRYFCGDGEDLRRARGACGLPLLRKDFIIDPWQVYESRLLGADCILLIAAILGKSELSDLWGLAREIGLDALVEVHNEDEADRALEVGSGLVGVNNRDLDSLKTDLAVSERLIPMLVGDNRVVVAESAIKDANDARRMREAGADAVLVGEALMKSDDVGRLVSSLRNAGSAA